MVNFQIELIIDLTDVMQSDGNSVCGDVVSQDQKCKKWILWNLYYGDFELKD